ncbi:MAG: Na+/H+ antiporter subunit E [Rickettsiales bacterium]
MRGATSPRAVSSTWVYAAALTLAWLALSGTFSPFFLALGALSVGAALFVSRAIGNHAHAVASPLAKTAGGVAYAGWLEWQIVLSALKVCRVILFARPISPGAFWTPIGDLGEAGAAVYANSITLTPGTATIFIDEKGRRLLVHALTDDDARGVESGVMHEKVRRWLIRGAK